MVAKHCDKHQRFNPNCDDCKKKRDEIDSSEPEVSDALYKLVVLTTSQMEEIPLLFEMMENEGYVFHTQISVPIFKILLLFKKK